MLIAHNGKQFDYPFLDQECKRWNFEIPRDWQWMDSVLLARQCIKDIPGQKVSRTQVCTWYPIANMTMHNVDADVDVGGAFVGCLPYTVLKMHSCPSMYRTSLGHSNCVTMCNHGYLGSLFMI